MRIAVLGAGSWGTTLAILLSYNVHQVTLWSHREEHTYDLNTKRENVKLLPGVSIPEDIEITSNLDLAISDKEMVVTAIPAQFLRSIVKRVRNHDFRNVVIVNVAKGIENDSLMTMSEVLFDVLPSVKRDNLVTLSGPSFAEEVSRQIPTAVVAASASPKTARLIQQTFMTPYFRVYSSNDVRGVELAGSIKNVIAIGAGIADGAGFGDNTKAAIMTRATAEIARLGQVMGADPRTFAGLSGIGDLIATCMSRHSRNRHVGEEIGRGRKLNEVLLEMIMVAEGVATTRSVHDLAKDNHVEMPIVNEVYQVLYENKDPIIATSDLMTRDAKGET
ncbi:MAG: NAD(P)H-dependent glycerol-3-phosphate dehydrogenase [Ignavibacteriae bacterium]|nr:NAD(P)H-dependent glycerol-3-phosphate dehydrogenase [Ignavibacteriota bacterium]